MSRAKSQFRWAGVTLLSAFYLAAFMVSAADREAGKAPEQEDGKVCTVIPFQEVCAGALAAHGRMRLAQAAKVSTPEEHLANVHIDTATVLEELGELGKARAEYEKALKINPNSVIAKKMLESLGHVDTGDAFVERSELESARTEYEKALKLNPNSVAKDKLKLLNMLKN